jgi:hypothetical protein
MNNLKNLIIIGFIGIFASSCTHEIGESITDNTKFSEQKTFGRRSLSEALALAKSSSKLLNSGDTRAAFERKINMKDMRVVCNATRSMADIDTLMYVFNFEDSLGFAVVSANEFTPGLIAITESGYYDPTEKQENEAFAALMESAKNYVGAKSRFGDIIPPPIIIPDTIINLQYEVSPMVTVKWGQDIMYGKYCYNKITGCAPLAAAQAMTYLEKPTSIRLTYGGHDVDTLYLNWNDIRSHILYYAPNGIESTLYCSASNNAHNVIGKLCFQLGINMSSTYYSMPDSTQNYTSTTRAGISAGLNSLGLPSTFVNYTSGSTISPLNNGHILYFTGYTESENGHAWLVDGYQLNDVQILTDGPMPGQYIYLHTDVYYNHVNWGWHGCFNGFFLDEVFNIQQSFCLDNNPYYSNANYNFTDDLQFIELY